LGASKLHSHTKSRIKKEAQQPQDLLGAYHQEAHGDWSISSRLQLGYDQDLRSSSLASTKHTFQLIAFALIS
jgi:hypothetical protein